MTLTVGTGPFAPKSPGIFNFERSGPAHVLYLHDHPRRIRAVFGGEAVVDSSRGKMLHETGHLPVWYVPLEDLREDVLERTDHSTHCPFKGDASYYSVRAGDRVAENAVWVYEEVLDSTPPIAGYAAITFDTMDAWYEEDEEIIGHLRDPFHRIDVRKASYDVRVAVNGTVVAESSHPKLLFETGLPTRYYLPAEDVRTDLLVPSDTTTVCPYKGVASYWSLDAGPVRIDDAAWTYRDPLHDGLEVADYLCFLGEGIKIEADDVPVDQ